MKLLATVFVAALIGGLAGAAIYGYLLEEDGSEERGAVVRFGGTFEEIEHTPFCVELQRFYLVQLESGEMRALYTYDTHQSSRGRNCEIRWLPDFAFVDPRTQQSITGWFRADCTGTTYRYSGERVFGPGPRDMDQFPVQERSSVEKLPDGEITVEYLEVDTRRLICGAPANASVPIGRQRAPLPQ